MIDLNELRDIALSNVVDPTTEYFYRFTCRWFSKTFHTPLLDVYNIPAHEVMLAYFEEGFETMDKETIQYEAQKTINPELDKQEEESVQDFIKMIEEEAENKRLSAAPKTPIVSKPEPAQEPSAPIVKTYNDDIPDDEYGDL